MPLYFDVFNPKLWKKHDCSQLVNKICTQMNFNLIFLFKILIIRFNFIQEAHVYCFDGRKQVKMYQTYISLKETVLSNLVIARR